ncbi:MAG: RNA methyltransferase [Lachnospiraceae bacterium]|jgi:tRNA G18 (ribose-2'-O)-methylase SpoU|nr:RNA methyltransferase [Lachnospiraceae bacterium]
MHNINVITDFSAPELDIYARLSEGQLLHYYEPDRGIFIAESPKVIGRALDAGYEPVSFLLETRHIEGEARELLARCRDIPVYTAEFDVLTKLTGFQLTRGVLCAMRRRCLPDVPSLCRKATRIAVLENVMNPTNVGAIFRSAAALGMDGVLLTPGCSDPLYRRASRVSMGTVFQVPWTFFAENPAKSSGDPLGQRYEKDESWPEKGMNILKELGFKTVAMALRDDSISLTDPALKTEEKLAIILGTEGDGLADRTIADCDYTVRIPMARNVDSLNASVAGAIAFWELGNKIPEREV